MKEYKLKENKIKLVAFDMDGTLLDSEKNLPKEFIPWVKQHSDLKILIASGRQYYKLEEDFIPIKDELTFVAENGSLVFEKDKIIFKNEMNKQDVKKVLNLVESNPGLTSIVCGAESAYMNTDSAHVLSEARKYYTRLQVGVDLDRCIEKDSIVKVAVFVNDKKAEEALKYFANLEQHLMPVLSGDSWIDVANASVNKGSAVSELLHTFGIDRSQAMAFGDYLNDVTLIKSCEESYCMENGHPELKALAKYIAPANDKNGVMQILNQRF